MDLLDGEPKLSQYADRTSLPTLEIAGGETLARCELVSGAEKSLRWVAAVVPEQLVGRRRRETVLREELIRAEPVVLLYRVYYVIATDPVPVGRMRHPSLPSSSVSSNCVPPSRRRQR